MVQIVTGILLAFYYQASPDAAYESVRYITEDAAYGWFGLACVLFLVLLSSLLYLTNKRLWAGVKGKDHA